MDKRFILYIIITLLIVAYSANGFSRLDGKGIGYVNNAKLSWQTSSDNVSIEPNQWLERIEVSDYTPHAGDEIIIEGYGWYPTSSNDYDNTVEIILRNRNGGEEITVGRIMPDENGHFEAELRIPDSFQYNDVVEIICNGVVKEILYIRD
ncbi:MAG: hypothetical protein SVN78_01365 [Deferribacterota bacterium]|nr:hypothetical protein [Deferribacterota bacterium]